LNIIYDLIDKVKMFFKKICSAIFSGATPYIFSGLF